MNVPAATLRRRVTEELAAASLREAIVFRILLYVLIVAAATVLGFLLHPALGIALGAVAVAVLAGGLWPGRGSPNK